MRGLAISLGIVAVAAFALALPAQPEVEVKTVPLKWTEVVISDGEALYAELCASCHGADAKGNGPAAAVLTVPVPDLTMLAMSYDGIFPIEDVEKAISRRNELLAHGTLEMPIWGRVLEDARPEYKTARREAFASLRVHNLAIYLESIQVPAH